MTQPRRAFEKKNKQPINQFIKAEKVRLISQTGEQLGVVELKEALAKAKDQELDLVQMNKDSDTPVCKMMDYGKHLFDQKKQKAASKKKTKKTQLKEIKFRPGTDENDYQIKMRNIIKFLNDGDKTKITMRFRGRELAHKEIGLNLLKRVESDLVDIANVEQEPISEGRQFVMLLSPNRK
ncbi:translation initiation factor IF-3 [SAR86 cluster bacterium]|nr:translation initiation factor IF-3 [SAR86 cluster bacterium]